MLDQSSVSAANVSPVLLPLSAPHALEVIESELRVIRRFLDDPNALLARAHYLLMRRVNLILAAVPIDLRGLSAAYVAFDAWDPAPSALAMWLTAHGLGAIASLPLILP